MAHPFAIRAYRSDDATLLSEFYSRVTNPYRPEDAPEVAAMHVRAQRAEATGDRWSPLPSEEPYVGEAAHLAFWVATSPAGDEIIGTVGLRRVGDPATAGCDTAEHSGLDLTGAGEVRRLRVAPEWRRRGVASALTQTLLTQSVALDLRELVLNTTAAQFPALALYQHFGFAEVGRAYLGAYELVWLHRSL